MPDKPAALREVARILRPGARFVLTTWDFFAPSAAIPVPQVNDHRPLLQEAGLAVEVYEETHDWKRRQLAVYERIRALRDTIIAEMGEAAARPYITHAHTRAAELDHGRRIFVTARRT